MSSIDSSKLKLLSELFRHPDYLPRISRDESLWIFENELDYSGKLSLSLIQSEYIRLFVNALPEVSCPPYASVYLEGTLMGASTVEVANTYRKYGLETSDSEMPDHIAVELEFLAFLSLVPDEVPNVPDDINFMITHLKCWTPGFLECVENNDRTGYFSQVSRAARKIIDSFN